MFAKACEILNLLQRKLLQPAFEKIDGSFFIRKTKEQGLFNELELELRNDEELRNMVNDPCELELLNEAVELTLYKAALGLNIETTIVNGDKATKTIKTIAPYFPAMTTILEARYPEKYGKNAKGGVTVEDWCNSVLEDEKKRFPEVAFE